MVFHGFWLVSMVFQGGLMVFHGFWLVSMVLGCSEKEIHTTFPIEILKYLKERRDSYHSVFSPKIAALASQHSQQL